MLADIPGLIEGAHEGAGLGDRFLGHVERCAVLLHLVDGAAGDVVRAWRTVREELAAYGGGLADKPELIGLNKTDAMTPREASARAGGAAKGVRAGRSCCCPARPARACPRCCARCKTSSTTREAAGAGRVIASLRPSIAMAQRIVVKIGSALVVDAEAGRAAHRLAGRRRRRHRRAARARRGGDRGLLRRHRAGAPRRSA